MPKRVLITGSRDWDDGACIEAALEPYTVDRTTVLVSGGCPTGADNLAEQIWSGWGLSVERHPADWNVHDTRCPAWHHGMKVCKRAGFRRNLLMVDLGADICLAFIKDNSQGATMTAHIAEKASITTIRFEVVSR